MNSLFKKIALNTMSFFLFPQSIINSREASSLDAYIADSYLHATFGPTPPAKKEKQEPKKKILSIFLNLKKKLLPSIKYKKPLLTS